jgi:translation initiation factor 4B
MKADAPAKSPTPETSNPPSPHPEKAPPVTRPRLNLQKRTVSEADPSTSPATAGDSKASPFGAARPVDTAAKERELDEKRQIAIRQKKEADDKAKAERAEEKRLAKESGDLDKVNTPTSPKAGKELSQVKENGEEGTPTQPAPKFDILRRADSGMNDMIADEENDEEGEPRLPVDDKAVKPKEIIVDSPAGQTNGSWRNQGAKQPETTAEALEEEGWSTVSKPTKQRNNRRNVSSRALAS